ncbi:hypothetical protein IRJ41_024975 [Triplophysa rosa]|uniref:ribonuclease H n=1 Tax=Triplophysa rosa TaxID=992332 RepID=A0A9W7T838_TRIRA|nr:hypothetical protein IRJ41_024975 [Triplophysa rosa]
MGEFNSTSLNEEPDVQSVFVNSCKLLPEDKTVLYVGSQRVSGASELFYAPVTVSGRFTLKGLLDSGSMSCTLNEESESKLQAAGILPNPQTVPSNVVLVGCGGLTVQPKCTYDLEIECYGFKFAVPTLVVPGQRDEFIIGSNVIKFMLQKMKSHDKYWELVSCSNTDPECEQFLELLSCISRWSGPHGHSREYLVWGKLPANVPVSLGSTVIVEPTTARSAPKNILVGRVATPMWGDRWVPMKILNPNSTSVTLRRNSKLADVSSCLAVEDFTVMQGLKSLDAASLTDPVQLLKGCGLKDIDIDGCDVSEMWKRQMAALVASYQDVFSKDKLDCGEAKDFVHRIRLYDEQPFRLPYRRIPPAHYQKLREVLSEMEEKGIICKSISEYASPLMMVWKKDGNLWVLLCYLDDLLVFAPSEQEALRRLETVFTRLRSSNLKLAPKKCHFLKKSVKFLGHVIDGTGVSVDEKKVKVISTFCKGDLMKEDGITPSQKKVRSFLGMVLYYQSFIPGCSRIARPLFNLTAGKKRSAKGPGGRKRAGTFRELTHLDWTPDCEVAFGELKRNLVESVVLAHPDFERPFLLSTDASLDGLGAVLSQIPEGEDKARPIEFASKALNHSQTKYPAHRLEFLALKWAVCDKFSHWLKGHEFTVWTDNNPLTYILTKPKLDACEQRWYVQSLISDLQSAMAVAQVNAAQEQTHQSNQYNKRVKGLPLAIGDQVLVTNKGCRGKRKLADRWEPVVYTVIASKPSLHIYRICDKAGNERTFQSDACSSVAEVTPTDVDQNEAVELSRAESMSNISGVATCGDDRTSSWVHSQLSNQSEPRSHLALPVVDDYMVASANPFPRYPVPDSVVVTQGPVADLNAADCYSTRFGRVIRPVRRLIESMVQLESILGLDSGSTVIHVQRWTKYTTSLLE